MSFPPIKKLASVTFAAFLFYPAAGALAQDAMPMFSIAYFDGPCPTGWDSAALASANGRTLLPTPRGGGAGGFVGEALGSQAEPEHSHTTASGSIDSPAKEFVLIDGCCNESLGHSGTHSMSGSAAENTSGLPYIQYNACLKNSAPDTGTLPSGMLFFSLLQCSGTSTAYNPAAGRYIVGLNPNGQPAATFGGANLQPSEIRTHTHDMAGTMSFGEHDIAGASGCCAHDYAGSGNVNFTGSTGVDTSADKYDAAVQAPYYTAFMCQAK